MGWRWWWCFWGMVALLSVGCSQALSPHVRQQVDTTVSLARIHSAPETYKGHTVMLGGEILSTRNLAEGTLLEILHKPLDSFDRPLETDQTAGRFMALCDGYLDAAIYSKGRELTLAGRVVGSRTDMVGEIAYVYPLLSCLEVRLWPPRPALTQYPPGYPYGYYGYRRPAYAPFWWRHHAWHPYW